MKSFGSCLKAPQIAILGLAFFLSVPFVASASVEYQQAGTNSVFSATAGNSYYIRYQTGNNSSTYKDPYGSPIPDTFFTTSSSITEVVVKPAGGQACNLINISFRDTANNFYYGGTPTASSTDCVSTITIGSSVSLNEFLFTYNGSPTQVDLYGSTANGGSSYGISGNFISFGGPAFALCSAGDCTGALLPPVDGVTISTPTAQTYYSNPLTFSGTYTSGSGFDQMTFDLRNTTYNQQLVFSSYALAPMSVVNEPWTFNESLYLNGNYELKARLYNTATGSTTPYSAITYFSLNSTSTDPLVAPTGTSTPVISCDPNSGYFQNSFCNLFVYLFSPSADVFNRFNTLKDDLKDHAPFGYFTSAYTALSALSGSSTPVFALSEVTPIMTYIFTPLKTGLSWLIWIVALIFLYKRLTNIHI